MAMVRDDSGSVLAPAAIFVAFILIVLLALTLDHGRNYMYESNLEAKLHAFGDSMGQNFAYYEDRAWFLAGGGTVPDLCPGTPAGPPPTGSSCPYLLHESPAMLSSAAALSRIETATLQALQADSQLAGAGVSSVVVQQGCSATGTHMLLSFASALPQKTDFSGGARAVCAPAPNASAGPGCISETWTEVLPIPCNPPPPYTIYANQNPVPPGTGSIAYWPIGEWSSNGGSFLSYLGGSASPWTTGTAQGYWSAWGVAVDGSANIWLADPWDERVLSYSNAGAYSSVFGNVPGSAATSYAITVAAPGQDSLGYDPYYQIQTPLPPAPANFFPAAIAVDPNGNVWVTDTVSGRLDKFQSGVAPATCSAGVFLNPTGVAADPSGNIWVVDQRANTLLKYDQNCNPIALPANLPFQISLNLGAGGDPNGAPFSSPQAIATDASGNVWIADTQNNQVREFDSNGYYLNQFPVVDASGAAGQPTSIAASADGSVWVGLSDGEIEKYSGSNAYSYGGLIGAFNASVYPITTLATSQPAAFAR